MGKVKSENKMCSENNNNNNNNVDLYSVPFETALDIAGFGLYSGLLTALTGLSIIAFACVVYNGTIIVPTSACDLNTTSQEQGLLMAIPLLGAILGSIAWGYLADTRGRRSMLLVSFCAATAVNCIATISVDWRMLIVFQFFAAFLASGQYSIPMTLLSESVPLARRNLVVLIVASIFMLSQGVMALFAMPIMPLSFAYYLPGLGIYWKPWRTTLLLYGLPSVVCFAWLYFMQESPKYVYLKRGEQEALAVLRTIHRINNRHSKEEFQVKRILPKTNGASENINPSKSKIVLLFRGKLLKYFIIMTLLAICQQVSAFMMWLPKIANQFVETVKTGEAAHLTLCNLQQSTDDCSLNKTALWMVFGVGCLQSFFNVILSTFIDKLGRRNAVMVIASVSGVSGILVNLVPNIIASAVFFVIFLMGVLLLGLSTAISIALFPTHLRALAVSLTLAGGKFMLLAVIPILRHLLEKNCALGFYIFASIFTASAVVVSFLPDDRYLKTDKFKKKRPFTFIAERICKREMNETARKSSPF